MLNQAMQRTRDETRWDGLSVCHEPLIATVRRQREFPDCCDNELRQEHIPGSHRSQNMQFLSILLAAFVIAVSATVSAAADPVTSGEYFITQSWSQEEAFKRPYFVNVPDHFENKRLPVFVFLHGNGADAKEALRGFRRGRKTIASQYIMVFPQGYRESWNIVSERSKAEDCRFIEAIVAELAKADNVDPKNFTIMGSSNGSALVNQLMIESDLPNVRNYISGVSPLNVWQYDGQQFKAKGAGNEYRTAAIPATGKRLMNISGMRDDLVPYIGGPSKAIPAKNGKLAFLAAEESTFVWARHMGYEGKRLTEPSRISGDLEVFSYLDGDVVHYKVKNEGHGAVHGIPEQALLDFLEGSHADRQK
jgi:polyhydroxybutyrate depolymerase